MNRSIGDVQSSMGAGTSIPQQMGSLCPIKFSPVRRSKSTPSSCPRPSPPRTFNISQIDRPSASLAPPLPRTTSTPGPREPQPTIAYEIIKRALVRYSSASSVEQRPPPTAVLVHGILGSRRNMQSFARRLVEGFPSWQIVLVDLRCHGESTPLSPFLTSLPHGVDSAAGDVLSLLSSLKLFPEVLIGHSFGGKVVMSMAHQFGRAVKTLPKPVSVWSLDSLPGEVRSGEMGATDRPADLITTLLRTQLPIANRDALISRLEQCGFSSPVSAWAASNLTPLDPQDRSSGFVWSFDLDGIAQMYESYVTSDLWPLLARPAEGIKVSFVKAENSTFRWGGEDEEKIRALGHQVHLLRNSGHWVHTDNPDGLFDILASSASFGGQPDLHMRRSPTGSQNSEYQ